MKMMTENKRFLKTTTPNGIYAYINLTKMIRIVFIALYELIMLYLKHKLRYYFQ